MAQCYTLKSLLEIKILLIQLLVSKEQIEQLLFETLTTSFAKTIPYKPLPSLSNKKSKYNT